MSSSCKSAIDCIDSRAPVRATYVNLYKWPESDAEFVKAVARKREGIGISTGRPAPAVVDSYSCRQMYLRSYTFSRKETMPQKTLKCLGRVREKAAELPFILQRTDSYASGKRNKKKNKKKKKRCMAVRKLVSSLFHRILSCTTKVDVVDGLSASRE